MLAAGSVEEHAQARWSARSQQKAQLAPEQAAKKIAQKVAEKIAAHRKLLGAEVEKAVRAAVDRVKLPARSELKLMHEKLAALEARLGELERGEGKQR